MFKFYRQEGCQFECRLRNSAKVANCIPWDYPIPPGIYGIDICTDENLGGPITSFKNFSRIMSDPEYLRNCSCLPNCEEVTYETQENRHSFKEILLLCSLSIK